MKFEYDKKLIQRIASPAVYSDVSIPFDIENRSIQVAHLNIIELFAGKIWSLVVGLWSLVFGLWSLVAGLWSLVEFRRRGAVAFKSAAFATND